jgi:hypothetical protein
VVIGNIPEMADRLFQNSRLPIINLRYWNIAGSVPDAMTALESLFYPLINGIQQLPEAQCVE